MNPSPSATRPVATVWRLRVMEEAVEEKRVGTRGIAGTPER